MGAAQLSNTPGTQILSFLIQKLSLPPNNLFCRIWGKKVILLDPNKKTTSFSAGTSATYHENQKSLEECLSSPLDDNSNEEIRPTLCPAVKMLIYLDWLG